MILGLRTLKVTTPDLAAGKTWYSQVVGHGPYFDEPFYVGFNVGGFELGLVPDGPTGRGGAEAYWGTPDIAAEAARLESLGAKVVEPIMDVGGGILVAVVADPFGNHFGIIQNPHFDPAAVV